MESGADHSSFKPLLFKERNCMKVSKTIFTLGLFALLASCGAESPSHPPYPYKNQLWSQGIEKLVVDKVDGFLPYPPELQPNCPGGGNYSVSFKPGEETFCAGGKTRKINEEEVLRVQDALSRLAVSPLQPINDFCGADFPSIRIDGISPQGEKKTYYDLNARAGCTEGTFIEQEGANQLIGVFNSLR